MKIAVCDDEPMFRELMYFAVEDYFKGEAEISDFDSAEELLEAVNSGLRPEVCILDIMLKNKSGIQAANALNKLCPDCSIIFVSSRMDLALDVYSAKHSYFILKEQFDERINAALKVSLQDRKNRACLRFKAGSSYCRLRPEELIYMERSLKKTFIFATDEREYTCSEKPADILSGLCRDIIRCHQSFYVNLRYVQSMESDCFILSDGRSVPVSRSFRREAREAFFKSLGTPE